MPKRNTFSHGDEPRQAKREWQLQDAKAQFSEVFRLARTHGPQRITKHGKEAVIVLPEEEFKRLSRRARQPRSLVRFFAESPLAGSGIRLARDRDYGRAIDL